MIELAVMAPPRHWTPAQVSGLKVWLDSSYITGVANGGALLQWRDRHRVFAGPLQLAAASRPTYLTGVVAGKPSADSDGSNDYMEWELAAFSLLRNVGGCTAIVVASAAMSGTQRTLLHWSVGTTSGLTRFSLRYDYPAAGDLSLTTRRLDADSLSTLTGTGPAAGAWHIATGAMDWTSKSAYLYLDGALAASSTNHGTAGSTEDTNSVVAQLGTLSLSFYHDGGIAEVLIWTRALSAGELAQVHRYLANKYGLVLA